MICKYNAWVNCDKEQCEKCGWNPKEAEERKKSIIFVPVIRRKKEENE